MGRNNTTQRGPQASPENRADDPTLTSFAGLIPFIKFLYEVLEIPPRLALVVDYQGRKRTYAIHHVLTSFLAGSVAGFRKLAHLEAAGGDAVLLKFLRMPSWPVRKVFSKALAGMDEGALSRAVPKIRPTRRTRSRGHRRPRDASRIRPLLATSDQTRHYRHLLE